MDSVRLPVFPCPNVPTCLGMAVRAARHVDVLARGELRYAPRYPVEVVDRIGAGDSFVAGLIHGLLDGDLDLAIRFGAFAAGIGLATPGDINYLSPEDVVRFHADTIGGLER